VSECRCCQSAEKRPLRLLLHTNVVLAGDCRQLLPLGSHQDLRIITANDIVQRLGERPVSAQIQQFRNPVA